VIYLVDTDTLIYMIRGLKIEVAKNERQREWRERGQRVFNSARAWARAGDDVGLSAITVAELEAGARDSTDYATEMATTHRILSPFRLFDFDATDCAFHYGDIRSTLEKKGAGIGSLDTLIAAHARALGATLVSNNLREFSRVPGLKCENWSA